MERYLESVTKSCTKNILNQMENYLYKINDIDEIAFFTYIKYENRNIPVMITENNTLNKIKDNYIIIPISNEITKIELGKVKYKSKKYNISIMEIKENKKLNYFEIDDNQNKENFELYYYKESIYIIQNDNNISVSYNKINNINHEKLHYFNYIKSKWGIILNLSNNKIIGMHENNISYSNKGIFFNYFINRFIQRYKNKELFFKYDNIKYSNEIDIIVKVNKEDINKNIYFLGENYNGELNELYPEIYNDNIKSEFTKYFKYEKVGEYNIKLKFSFNLIDCSYMFNKCKNIININFVSFNTERIKNMNYMFSDCSNLNRLDLSSFHTKNVINMENIFSNNIKLENLIFTFEELKEEIKNNICKIYIDKEEYMGFFCKIPFTTHKGTLPFLIINSLSNKIKGLLPYYINQNKKIIDIEKRKKYTFEKFNITLIEIYEKDEVNNYLDIDYSIINELLDNNNEYSNKNVYIMKYPYDELPISYGIIEDKNVVYDHKFLKKDIKSSNSIVLNLNNKIIGIYKEGIKYSFKEVIQPFINHINNLDLMEEFNKHISYGYDFKKIQDYRIEKLDLGFCEIGNDGFKILCKIYFKYLKELDLCENNITDIKALENSKFEILEILNLNQNHITDINILEKVNFKYLKQLNLHFNNISDIKVLENVKTDKLEILNLSFNKISDINILEKININELKELILGGNNISNFKVLENINCKKLEILNLCKSNLSDISILVNLDFKELKELILSNNKISDISILQKVKFEKLEELDLSENNISDIKVLEKVKFENLRTLNLKNNKISNINILEKVNFKKLRKLYLDDNNISEINILLKFDSLSSLGLKNNKINKKKNASIISNLNNKIRYFFI